MSFGEDEYDGHEQVTGCMFAYDADAKPHPVEGVLDGTRIVLLTTPAVGLGSGRKTAKVDVVGVQGTVVNFLLTVDADGDPLPVDMEITGVRVYPNDGADPAVAVSTIWALKMFSHSDRGDTDVVYIEDHLNRATSPDPMIDNSRWDYLNEEGNTEIPCSIEILGGATNATFTVKITFR